MTLSENPRLFAIGIGLFAAIVTFSILMPLLLTDRDRLNGTHLIEYTHERSQAVYGLFSELTHNHNSARRQFERTYAALSDDQVETLFQTHFPEHASGNRRGRDEDYDGSVSADGTLTYGMGSFLGLQPHDARARRAVVSAFLTVRSAGPAHREQFDNFYFNDAHRLIMYGPEREDRLEFYRHTAPADLSFSEHPFVQIVSPAQNPLGQTVCTSLTDLIYARDQRALTIGCHTPVRVNGLHVGAFGTTLPVHDYLATLVNDPSGREALVISREGRIVAHRALFASDVITDQDVASVAAELELDELAQAITANGRASGMIDDPVGSGVSAFAKLEAPGWYLVIREPAAAPPIGPVLLGTLIALLAGLLAALQVWSMRTKDNDETGEALAKA